jgi:hypothetical protein
MYDYEDGEGDDVKTNGTNLVNGYSVHIEYAIYLHTGRKSCMGRGVDIWKEYVVRPKQ